MRWLKVYLCGWAICYFTMIAHASYEGRREEVFVPALISSTLWPIASIYTVGAVVGEGLR